MAYIQKVTPAPNKVLTFSLKNFTGGLNNKSDNIEDNQASDILNMAFSDKDTMETRPGQKFYDDMMLDDNVVYIGEFKPYNDGPVLVRATKEKFYIEDQILTEISGKPSCVNHSGMFFFVDGAKIWVYGRFAQESSTYVNVIGTPIDEYVLLEVISPDIDAVRLDTSHTRGVLNVDYTNFHIFYVPCENEFVDVYKGANVVPVNPSCLVSHNGRLYASGVKEDDDNVFITAVGNPFYFPVSLPMQVPPNSDKIIGLAVYDNSVIIGRHHDLFAITGYTNNPTLGAATFKLVTINSHTGFASSTSFNVAHNYLFFAGSDGNFYSLGSTFTDFSRLATTVISKDIDIRKAPINLTLSDLQSATSLFFDGIWYVAVKDLILLYSYECRGWSLYRNFNTTSFYSKEYELIWGKSNGKTAMFDKDNFLDFGVPYQSYFYSKRFDMKDASNFKHFKEFFLVAHTYNNYPSDINVLFEIDYVDVVDRLIVSNKISVFGKAIWGDRFVTRNINDSLPFILGRRGRTLRFKFSCNYEVSGAVDAYSDLQHYPGKVDGLLLYVTDENKYYLYMDNIWTVMTMDDLNQRMKIYQVNGDYELRGKR